MLKKMLVRDALLLAAQQIVSETGNETLSTQDLKRRVAEISGHNESSVIPSDFCYDSVNEARTSFTDHIFIREGRGHYKCLGQNFPYTGEVFWKPKSQEIQKVGGWKNGVCELTFDPRRTR